MMAPRTLLLCTIALGLAGCGAEEEPAAPGAAGGGGGATTVLRVVVDPDGDGMGKPARERVIRCEPADRDGACGAAARLRAADFAPVPADRACTEIFGGPETARVAGELRGEPVRATFSRTNGCEIARWERVQRLFR